MTAKRQDGVIFIEGEPLLDDAEAYQALIADLLTRLRAVPSEDQFNKDLHDEQEARRFRRRHMLLAALQSVANHSVAADTRTLALQDQLFELSRAVRDFQDDVDRLDRGLSANLIASPAPYEMGERIIDKGNNRSQFIPERADFITPERKLILIALALSSVVISGTNKEEIRNRVAKISDQNPESLKSQEDHLKKSIEHHKNTKKTGSLEVESHQRYSLAEIDFYNSKSKEFMRFQKRFDNGKAEIDETDPDAPRSVFDLAKVVLFGWGNKRLTPSTVKPRKR